MKTKDKKFWSDIIDKDSREVRRIERAVERKDTHYLDDWFGRRYGKTRHYNIDTIGRSKTKKDDWL